MKGKLIKTVILALCVVFAAGAVSAEETLVIKGSTTVLPIAQLAVEAYMQEHPDVKISLSGGGSSNGIKAMIDGSTNIANASRFIKESEMQKAVKNGVFPVPYPIAYDSIIPVVHPSNNLTNITLDQLKDIYMGKIKNFKEIGGPDKPIVICSRDTSSGTYETWEKIVMKKERVTPRAQLLASNGAVVTAVAGNPNAIGYIGIGYVNENVKGLTVNGVEGTEETTLGGEFPISRLLYMFTGGCPGGVTKDFMEFMLNPEKGQKFVAESGYVKLMR